MRPRMCDAKCGTVTHGRIRKRVLYATPRMLRRRASADQPMKRSRGPRWRGAGDRAIGRDDEIFQVLADRLLIPEIVMLREQAVEERLVRRTPHLVEGQRP